MPLGTCVLRRPLEALVGRRLAASGKRHKTAVPYHLYYPPPLTFSSKDKGCVAVCASAQELFLCIRLDNSSLISPSNRMNTYSALMWNVSFDRQGRHSSSDFLGLWCRAQVLGFFKAPQIILMGSWGWDVYFLQNPKSIYRATVCSTDAHYLVILEKLCIAWSSWSS